MKSESGSPEGTVELRSATERGWWLHTRHVGDMVNMIFRVERANDQAEFRQDASTRGPFEGEVVTHDGRTCAVQVCLKDVIGGYIVDIDTADGESRVIFPAKHQLDHAVGSTAGYFAVADLQLANSDD